MENLLPIKIKKVFLYSKQKLNKREIKIQKKKQN